MARVWWSRNCSTHCIRWISRWGAQNKATMQCIAPGIAARQGVASSLLKSLCKAPSSSHSSKSIRSTKQPRSTRNQIHCGTLPPCGPALRKDDPDGWLFVSTVDPARQHMRAHQDRVITKHLRPSVGWKSYCQGPRAGPAVIPVWKMFPALQQGLSVRASPLRTASGAHPSQARKIKPRAHLPWSLLDSPNLS